VSADLDRLRSELAEIEQRIAEQQCVTSPTAGRVDDVDLLRASSLHRKIADAEQVSATTEPRGDADATVPEPVTEPSPPEELRGDIAATLDFLERWRPGGPWVVTAITTDKKSIETRTFDEATRDQLTAWIEEHNGVRNIYFMVNPATRALTKKADREDVAALAWLHVDVDPRAGEDIAAEQERALRLLREPLGSIPPPTVIVFSGGGYQGFWKLREPLAIDGDLAKAERAKLYNLQLEHAFGGDHCHNVDRIMRLPGTINVPDKVKLKKGRVPALARLVEWHEDGVYDLAQFTAAPEAKPSGAVAEVAIGAAVRIADLAELDQWSVPDRVKVIIVQGDNRALEGPKQGDDSRSAWLFDALCNMARCGVPDDVMYSVIMDEAFGISASVLDKGSRAEKYALRQISQAKEFAIDPRLPRLNDRYAVVKNIGGRCRVVEEVHDSLARGVTRPRLTTISFGDFKNAYCNESVEVPSANADKPPRLVPLGKWWVEHPARRQFDKLTFSPGRDVPGAYNLWQGFACEARPGDCALFLDHLRDNICAGENAHYEYLLGWMARAVQEPDSPGETAVVMRGGQGTGKSFFAKQLGAIFGRHFMQVADPKFLVGSFNAHLRDCVLLFGDEAFFAGDRKHRSILKALITEEQWVYEKKGHDVELGPNFTHIVLASNSHWVVPAEIDDRRFFVLDVSDGHKQDGSYFKAIADQMSQGGREALLHLLMTRDLSGFDVRAVPKTRALNDQKSRTLEPVEEAWLDCLREGAMPHGARVAEGYVLATSVFREFIQKTARREVSANAISTFLGRPPRRGESRRKHMAFRKDREGARGWLIPDLLEARRRWDEVMWPEDWDDASEWECDARVPF
jgi:hypothetical protein